jgi:septum formation protein
MLQEKLKNFNVILASGSPRRQEFFKDLNIDFEIRLKPIEEVYPNELKHEEITNFLSELKAKPFQNELNSNDLLVTSDTIVWFDNGALGKPKDANEAFNMLKRLSDATHDVITSVCFTTTTVQKTVNALTKVTFKNLSDDEIWYYLNTFKPYDKAGAYGIQDWIGKVAVTNIEGSYFNVMGLPLHLVYKTLNELADML